MKQQTNNTFDLSYTTRGQLHELFNNIFARNGKLYGGFVRNCVIPNYIEHKNFNIHGDPIYKFKDIDVWLKSLSDLVSILSRYHSEDKVIDLILKSKNTAGGDLYEFTVHRFNFCNNMFTPTKLSKDEEFYPENNGFTIEFIVLDKCPVNDFYINMLTVSNMTANSIELNSENHMCEMRDLINQISCRTIDIIPSYFDKLMSQGMGMGMAHKLRLLNRYLMRGWYIRYEDKTWGFGNFEKSTTLSYSFQSDFSKLVRSFKFNDRNTFDHDCNIFIEKYTPLTKGTEIVSNCSNNPRKIVHDSLDKTLDLLDNNPKLFNLNTKLTSSPCELRIGEKIYKITIKVEGCK